MPQTTLINHVCSFTQDQGKQHSRLQMTADPPLASERKPRSFGLTACILGLDVSSDIGSWNRHKQRFQTKRKNPEGKSAKLYNTLQKLSLPL